MKTSAENENMDDAMTLKEKGNECVKNGKYEEAALLYSQAIKLEPNNYSFYSNRSLAYLKLNFYNLALEDAKETISLEPRWAKGYFRQAEVEAAAGANDEAIISYLRALDCQPNDQTILNAFKKISEVAKKQRDLNDKLPWICACVGIIIGVIIVLYDSLIVEHLEPTNPIIQVARVVTIAGGGWVIGYHYIIIKLRNIELSLMNPSCEGNRISWVNWMTGLVGGAFIIILDSTVYEIVHLQYNIFGQILFVLAISGICWGIGSTIDYLRTPKTETPIERDSPEPEANEENQTKDRISNKYTKAQARYRYKKGKNM